MYGAMYVTNTPMPDLTNDIHIPPSRRSEAATAETKELHTTHTGQIANTLHPYQPIAPYVYRIFMPDASPATIAVHLPQKISYCWDAGTCHLRYAWQGEFLANTDQWQGKGDTYGKLGGPIFFRDKSTCPLQIGKAGNKPITEYKGYKLINRYPEFHYQINGVDIYELLTPKKDGSGLVRTFSIPKSSGTVWFTTHPEDGVMYESSKGKWVGNKLKLSARQAQEFTIVMTKKEGVVQ